MKEIMMILKSKPGNLAKRTAAAVLFPALLCASAAHADVKAGVDAWTPGDFSAAVHEWQGPADKGDADAQFNLAQAYKLGRGVPQDLARAELFYAKAAAQGHLQAGDYYGLFLFQRGQHAQAMPYIQAAADRGDPRGQYLLGIAHFNGDIVAKDWVRAYALTNLAQQAGLPQAKDALAQMDTYIPLDQRQRGVALASDLGTQAEANRARAAASVNLGTEAPAGLPRMATTAPAMAAAPVPALAAKPVPVMPARSAPPAARPAPIPAPMAQAAPHPAPLAMTDTARTARGLPPAPRAKPGMAEGSGQTLDRGMGRRDAAGGMAGYSPYPAPPAAEPAPRGPWDANSPATASSAPPPHPGAYLNQHLAKSRDMSPVPTPALAPVSAPASASGGNWRIQLGAFGVPGNAEALWAKLKGRPEIAGHAQQLVPTGKVTRLMAAGYSQEGAAAACHKLTAQGISCLPARD